MEETTQDEKIIIWDLIYKNVSESIKKRQNFAILFSTSDEEEGVSAIITKDQYLPLIENYLLISQEQEKYEICREVNKIITELKSWIGKN